LSWNYVHCDVINHHIAVALVCKRKWLVAFGHRRADKAKCQS